MLGAIVLLLLGKGSVVSVIKRLLGGVAQYRHQERNPSHGLGADRLAGIRVPRCLIPTAADCDLWVIPLVLKV